VGTIRKVKCLQWYGIPLGPDTTLQASKSKSIKPNAK
jgi:hypothetical protein